MNARFSPRLSFAVFFCGAAIVVNVIAQSLFTVPFFDATQKIQLACLILTLIGGITLVERKGVLVNVFIVLLLFLAGMFWSREFSLKMQVPFHLYNSLSFSGIYSCLAFYVLATVRSVNRSIKFLLVLSSIVAIFYLLFAGLTVMSLGPFGGDNAAILVDPSRGRRFYLSSALVSLSLFWSLRIVKSRPFSPAFIIFIVSALGFYISYSRFAQFCVVVVILNMLLPNFAKRLIALFCAVIPMAIFAIWLYDPYIIVDIFSGDKTLEIRSKAFPLANYLFLQNPISGIGIPSDPDALKDAFKVPIFFSDLGMPGVFCELGLSAAFVIAILFFNLIYYNFKSHRREKGLLEKSLGDTCIFILLYSTISPSIMFGDGSIMMGCVIALNIYGFLHGDKENSDASLAEGLRYASGGKNATSEVAVASPIDPAR